MSPMTERAESERGRVRITGLKGMELRSSSGQSLVRIDTDSGLFGIGEAGVAGPACRANLLWLDASSSVLTRSTLTCSITR